VVAVRDEEVESGLDQSLGGLPVEPYFGVTAARCELEAVVRSPITQALGDGLGVGFEDDGEVGTLGFRVELPEERRVNAVKALYDQARRHVPVRNDDLADCMNGRISVSMWW
jgi:hypothetical protein